MNFFFIFSICTLSLGLISLLIIFLKSGRFIKSLFINCFIGICILILINLLFKVTGVKIPVNEYTVPFIAFFGVPGIILILISPFIFA
ncbi:MAG: pro-sigmaK processing inhibitor BofA family protein [Clostridia bacterium]|nr:pro-sigmaK processing inhibitor BofA family protein [Clostridia bacterium]